MQVRAGPYSGKRVGENTAQRTEAQKTLRDGPPERNSEKEGKADNSREEYMIGVTRKEEAKRN